MKQMVNLDFCSAEASVPRALDRAGLGQGLQDVDLVLLKPNLVSASPHPVTTKAAFCEAAARWVLDNSRARVVVAEGTGDAARTTEEMFDIHGYREMAARLGVELMDLNVEPVVRVDDPVPRALKEMWLPRIAFQAFIVSLPVLKAHSLAGVTGSLKNMMGFAPPEHYQGGGWKKAAFHARMQGSIIDLCAARCPDFTLLDASQGLADYHLGGPVLDPPPARVLAGSDPFAVDREAAGLLGLDWRSVGHLSQEARERCQGALANRDRGLDD